MNDKELEKIAEKIAKAMNDGKPEEATEILQNLINDTKTKVLDVIPSMIKAIITVEPRDTL